MLGLASKRLQSRVSARVKAIDPQLRPNPQPKNTAEFRRDCLTGNKLQLQSYCLLVANATQTIALAGMVIWMHVFSSHQGPHQLSTVSGPVELDTIGSKA